MKIAVSSTGTTLDAEIDERFGRAAYILIVDTDTLDVEVLDNSANIRAAQGAGIQAASMVSAKGAKALITGSCGPKAMNAFSAVKLDVYTGQAGSVRQAVERFRQGGLSASDKANVGEKYGMSGVGPAMNKGGPASFPGGGKVGSRGIGCGGRGRGIAGGGRGMGGGGGMGLCGGRGMGNAASPPPVSVSKAETVDDLKKQAAALKVQLEAIQKKIQNL